MFDSAVISVRLMFVNVVFVLMCEIFRHLRSHKLSWEIPFRRLYCNAVQTVNKKRTKDNRLIVGQIEQSLCTWAALFSLYAKSS